MTRRKEKVKNHIVIGVLKSANGDIYEGDFMNDMKNGNGMNLIR